MSNSVITTTTRQHVWSQVLEWGGLVAMLFTLALAPILFRWVEAELSPIAAVADRFWIGTSVFLSWQLLGLLRRRPDVPLPRQAELWQSLPIFVLGAGSSVLCMICWVWSLQQTSIANSNILHNLTPIFTVLGGFLLFQHRFNAKFFLGLAIALIGVCALELLSFKHIEAGTSQLWGDGVALISALFYASGLLAREKLRERFSTTTVQIGHMLFKSLLIIPFVVLFHDALIPASLTGKLAVIGLGLICELTAQWLMCYFLKSLSAGLVSVILLLEPVLATLLAWYIVGEAVTIAQFVAFPLILGGIYLAKRANQPTPAISGAD